MITREDFEKLAKQIMDQKIRKFLREQGCDFGNEMQIPFVDHLQAFLFKEFVSMGYAKQLFGEFKDFTTNSR